jgi:hypothetical protein
MIIMAAEKIGERGEEEEGREKERHYMNDKDI